MIPAMLLMQTPGKKSRRVLIEKEIFTMGRGKECDLRIRDPFASEEHCRIVFDSGGFTVTDLTSKNGTLLNGQPVTETDLRWGDVIKIGETSLAFLIQETEDEPNLLMEEQEESGTGETTHATVSLSRKVDPIAAEPPQGAGEDDSLRAYRSLYLIHTLVSTINTATDLTNLIQHVLTLLIRSTKASRGKIILLGSSTDEELVEQTVGGGKMHIEPRILKTVVEGREAVLLRSANADQKKPFTAICSPLTSRQQVVGALYLDTSGGRQLFDAQDLELVGTLSSILGSTIDNVRTYQKVRSENVELKRVLFRHHDLVSASAAMRGIQQLIEKYAVTESTVLITGESGVGKELVAQAIHFQSARKNGPFVVVNCGAIPTSLMESELFGYEKGAFTGAYKTKPGKFEEAHHGTLFLDEIGELDPESQVKFLRAIEQKSIQRIGGAKTLPVDIRIIAATNRELKEAVRSGGFREDLYFRIKVLEIHVPPLRDRKEDIASLVEVFLKETAANLGKKLSIDPETMKRLARHAWPGNVRELRNAIERAAVLCDTALLTGDDFDFLSHGSGHPAPDALLPLSEIEKNHILAVLASVHGNKSEAAKILGITRSTLYEKLRSFGIETASEPPP